MGRIPFHYQPTMSSKTTHSDPPPVETSTVEPRRNFLLAAAASVIGTIIMVIPVLSGLWVFTDPLRRKKAGGKLVRVTTLDAVPDDGLPKLFTIVQDRADAWNLYKNEPVGSVYITRQKGAVTVQVLHTCCPHAGCAVSLASDNSKFLCPCHNSAFALDGAMIQPTPSPRPLDQLKVEIKGAAGQEEIWVNFENYKTGVAEQVVRA
jgi:menaquinol-cytochrome c reductase iron-sulfur subunit